MPVAPAIADLHSKVYEAVMADGNHLEMGNWHTCETTHCRGGWVVALAGPEGKSLESIFGTEQAAMQIYAASYPGWRINPCRFYDSNENAMEDIRKMAQQESIGK